MSLMSGWKRLFRLSESDKHVQAQVDDELRHHLEELLERYRSQGMSETEAQAEIARRFPDLETTRSDLVGSTGRTADSHRRRLFLDGLRSDLRVSLRQFRRRPGFTALAVLTLGLGIGASTTLFSVVNGVLLRPLPYPEPERLIYLGTVFGNPLRPAGMTPPEFLALQGSTHTLEAVASSRQTSFDLTVGGQPERLTVACVTGDYFRIFGALPALGRSFTEDDYRSGSDRVVILSHNVWQLRWGGDPDIIGATFSAGEERSEEPITMTVIGVMPPDFRHPQNMENPFSRLPDTELWTPLQLAGMPDTDHWTHFNLLCVGRLNPGRSVLDVRAEIESLATSLAAAHPEFYTGRLFEGRSLGVVPLLEATVGDRRGDLLLLFGVTGLLLLIAIANIIGLYLARALDRTRELAIRGALGAGSVRIVRQFVTESIVFTLFGCLVGIGIAGAGIRILPAILPADFPRLDAITLDLRVLCFAGMLAVLTGVLCGLVPSLLNARRSTTWNLSSRSGGYRATARLRAALVTVELTLSLTLLIGAGLLLNSFMRLRTVDPGIEPRDLLIMPIRLPRSYTTDESQITFYSSLALRLQSVPGVRAVSWISDPPMGFCDWTTFVRIEGVDDDPLPLITTHPVGPAYFQTMGIPLLSGREFTREDDDGGEPVAVVDDLMAETYWPEENPIGKRLCLAGDPDGPWYTVIGVVGAIRQESPASEPLPNLYLPYLQHANFRYLMMVIRTGLEPETIAPQLRASVWELDRHLPVPVIENMEDRIDAVLRIPRFRTFLLGIFALSALVLTLAGIYALMLYLVAGRTREIGIRVTLGATRGSVFWTVSKQCLLLIGIGTLIGLGAAALTSRVLVGFLFGITPLDLSTYVAVSIGLSVTALLSCLMPARRATRIDPSIALRWE